MSATSWVSAPVGVTAAQWVTVPVRRTVLVIVHTVTSANRLIDILPIFEADSRVQLVFATPGTSAISEGVVDILGEIDGIVIPWDQAVATRFDLAISVNHSGDLHRIAAPVILLSHGIGYTKLARSPEPYGMSRDWLLRGGAPFAAAFVLSHEAQREQLAAAVPEAVPTTVVVGDPCYDRLRASQRLREQYRRALGLPAGAVLVVLSSTWDSGSLLGSSPELVRQLLAELPLDLYRTAMVVHPNAWYAHGPWQLTSWYADCLRAGLVLVPPSRGWQQAILAADVVIGDHGAVTGYAAALGRPTALAAFPGADVVPGTAIAALGQAAPRLQLGRPLRDQIDRLIRETQPQRFAEVARLTSSVPGEAARRLRELCYRLMRLEELPTGPPVHVFTEPELPPPRTPEATLVAGSLIPATAGAATAVGLRRYPADVLHVAPQLARDVDGHLVVHLYHPFQTLRATAAVLYCYEHELDLPAGEWLGDTLAGSPACLLAAVVEAAGSCLVSDGRDRIRFTPVADGPHPVVSASLAYLWLADGRRLASLPGQVALDTGHGQRHVTVHHDPRT